MKSPSLFNLAIALAGNLASIARFAAPEHRSGVFWTYLRFKVKEWIAVKLLGLHPQTERMFGFTVEFFDYPTFVLLFEEVFVTDVYYFLCDTNTPLILDGGSNIGMSVLYFKWLYPQARIIAFEPDPDICKALERNINRNHLQHVQVVNKALCSSEGVVAFFRKPNHPGSTVNSMFRESLRDSEETAVPGTRLSRYLREEECVDLLKLDIEGMESAVLAELVQSNKLRLVKEIVAEYHHNLTRNPAQLARYLALLEDQGFRYQIQASLRTPFPKDHMQALFIYAYRTSSQLQPPADPG